MKPSKTFCGMLVLAILALSVRKLGFGLLSHRLTRRKGSVKLLYLDVKQKIVLSCVLQDRLRSS